MKLHEVAPCIESYCAEAKAMQDVVFAINVEYAKTCIAQKAYPQEGDSKSPLVNVLTIALIRRSRHIKIEPKQLDDVFKGEILPRWPQVAIKKAQQALAGASTYQLGQYQ